MDQRFQGTRKKNQDRLFQSVIEVSDGEEMLENLKQDSQCTYNITLRRVCESLLLWKSSKYYIFVCVHVHKCGCPGTWVHVALLIQYAMCMRHIVTSFVAPLAPPHFLTLSDKWRNL
jgi:hypothetical protein